jgi:uncharacterized protein (TIGR03086 family)
MPTTTSTLDDFTTAAGPWTAAVRAVTDWDAATPCEGWTARDLVDHVITTERGFFADRGLPLEGAAADDPAAAWDAHRASVERALADPAVPATEYQGWFGPTTVGDAFGQYYVFDLYVHRWDLARAADLDDSFTDTELDRIEADIAAWGDALYLEGICKQPLEAPADADRTTRVLARLGRR